MTDGSTKPSENAPTAPFAFTSRDGLALRGTHYFARSSTARSRRPVLCLAGLTRNGRDFEMIATALSAGPNPRDVYTLDMRGRGRSDFDRDWRNYSVLTECADVLDALTVLGLSDVAILGTSRGGLIAMAMMAVQPARVGLVMLNDIGPVIETAGLARIAGYVGKLPPPKTWGEAENLVSRAIATEFPKIDEATIATLARAWFNETADGRPVPGYDPNIARTFSAAKGGVPELWPQFKAMTRIPCLAIRGANSDLLSAATLKRMAEMHPRFAAHTVPDEGHAPLLRDRPTIEVVSAFLASFDETAHHGVRRPTAESNVAHAG